MKAQLNYFASLRKIEITYPKSDWKEFEALVKEIEKLLPR